MLERQQFDTDNKLKNTLSNKSNELDILTALFQSLQRFLKSQKLQIYRTDKRFQNGKSRVGELEFTDIARMYEKVFQKLTLAYCGGTCHPNLLTMVLDDVTEVLKPLYTTPTESERKIENYYTYVAIFEEMPIGVIKVRDHYETYVRDFQKYLPKRGTSLLGKRHAPENERRISNSRFDIEYRVKSFFEDSNSNASPEKKAIAEKYMNMKKSLNEFNVSEQSHRSFDQLAENYDSIKGKSANNNASPASIIAQMHFTEVERSLNIDTLCASKLYLLQDGGTAPSIGTTNIIIPLECTAEKQNALRLNFKTTLRGEKKYEWEEIVVDKTKVKPFDFKGLGSILIMYSLIDQQIRKMSAIGTPQGFGSTNLFVVQRLSSTEEKIYETKTAAIMAQREPLVEGKVVGQNDAFVASFYEQYGIWRTFTKNWIFPGNESHDRLYKLNHEAYKSKYNGFVEAPFRPFILQDVNDDETLAKITNDWEKADNDIDLDFRLDFMIGKFPSAIEIAGFVGYIVDEISRRV